MNRIVALLAIVVFVVSCSSPKYFRKLNTSEAAQVKAAQKIWGKKTDAYRVLIMTDSGNMVVRLYNETPLHRDNFVSKARAGFYDSLLFHRVINKFMIQGGDPKSKHAPEGEPLGNGEAPGKRIAAEIHTDKGLYHKKGVLAAARDQNAEKASSNCQFYIAQGKVFTPAELETFAKNRNLTLNEEQKKIYTTVGGVPHLDNNYTVYGELETGVDVLDKLAAVKTAPGDRPLKDVRMYMFVISELKK
jgi:cyclophilin family peptidyl-prolyl cis-trans isomerase